MYYIQNRGNFRNIFLIVLVVLCCFLLIKGCRSNENFNKERKEINKNIKMLEAKYDSLDKISNSLILENMKYQEEYKRDSIVIDSLGVEIDNQIVKAIEMETKANIYLDKYRSINKKIIILEKNKNYKTGDTLLRSLGKQIN